MTDKFDKRLIVRKVRNKDQYAVKLNGKELAKFDNKEDALNYKHEFLGNNKENLQKDVPEEKKISKKKKTGSVSLKK